MRVAPTSLIQAAVLTLFLLTARTVQAQSISIDLSTAALGNLTPGSVINVAPGDSIDFLGLLTNTLPTDPGGANDLLMDSVSGNILGPGSDVTLEPTAYYDNFFLADPTNPGLIQAQQTLPASGTAGIFTVTVPLTAVPGTYFGTFDIFDASANILGEVPFTVQVNAPAGATPEPSSALTLLCSASSLLLVLRRKKRAVSKV